MRDYFRSFSYRVMFSYQYSSACVSVKTEVKLFYTKSMGVWVVWLF